MSTRGNLKRRYKMLNIIKIVILPAILFLGIASVQAADYSSMGTQELSELRGTMFNATKEDQEAFRAEWTKRIQNMNEEEKSKYFTSGSGRGAGNRGGMGLGDGSGRGRGNGQQGQGGNGVGNSAAGQKGQGGNGASNNAGGRKY